MIKKINLTSNGTIKPDGTRTKGDAYAVYLYTGESYNEIEGIQKDMFGETYRPDRYGNPFQYMNTRYGKFVFARVAEITPEEFARVTSLMKYVGYVVDTNEFCKIILNFEEPIDRN